MTKIAVASTDGASISQHFGQSAGFIVFDIDGTEIIGSQWRAAGQSPHSAGICQHGDGEQPRRGHGGFLEMISDCQVVLCGGMGSGAAQAIVSAGLQPLVLPASGDAKAILSRYLKGELEAHASATCQCHH